MNGNIGLWCKLLYWLVYKLNSILDNKIINKIFEFVWLDKNVGMY